MDVDEYMNILREKVLSDCRPDRVFWTCNGRVIRNLHELAKALGGMNDSAFKYHVNKEKNDFAAWIINVLEDGELAYRLKKVKDRMKAIDIIKKRIEELEAY